jgi:hypothetical protein
MSDVGEMKITNTVRVDFSIGTYTDTVECDEVPITISHLLLGRPWQYDRVVHHNGKANTHQLHWKVKDIILHPITPQAIVNESQQKTEVWLEQGEPRREPSLAVYEPFSAMARALYCLFCCCASACASLCHSYRRIVCTDHGHVTCSSYHASRPVAPATTTAPAASTTSTADGVSCTLAGPFPPLFGDADGSATTATAMTDTGTYILMATKEDLRELGADPMVIPLVLVYKGEILVSNDSTLLSLGVSIVL